VALTERLALLITGDSKGAVKAIEDVGRAADKNLGTTDKRLEKTGLQLQRLGAGALGVGALFTAGLAKSAQKAGELEQAVGGTQAVFKESAGVIDQFAKSAARSMGLSERAFREATTRIGGSLKGLGFETDDAADRAVELTGVAADLAATYGGTTAEAVDALGAAFRGEADPAERFNLFLNQTRVNAKAVALGLAESESAVSANAKAQATLALILEQSADAQGQFSREADTLIGKQQIATAEAENASAALGEGFVPVMEKVSEAISAAATGFSELDDATGGAASTVAAFGSIGLTVGGAIAVAVGKVIELRTAFAAQKVAAQEAAAANALAGDSAVASAGKFSKLATAAGIAVAAYVAVENASQDLDEINPELKVSAEEAQAFLEDTTGNIKQLAEILGEIETGRGLTFFENLLQQSRPAAEKYLTQLEEAGYETGKLRAIFDKVEPAAGGVAAGLDDIGGSAAEAIAPVEELGSAFQSILRAAVSTEYPAASFYDFNDTMDGTEEKAGRVGAAVDLVAKKNEAVASTAKAAEDAFWGFQDSAEALADAQDGLLDAQKKLDEALKGPSEQDRAKLQDDVTDATLSLQDATFGVEDAQKKLTEAQTEGDPSEIARAQNDLEQAMLRRKRAQEELTQRQSEYNQVANWTKENDPKVAEAQDGVTEAQKRLEKQTRLTKDAWGELNDRAREADETVNASLATFGASDSALYNNRRNVMDTKGAYLDLAEAIDKVTESIIANAATGATALQEIDGLLGQVNANPYLSEAQKQQLRELLDASRERIFKERQGDFADRSAGGGILGGGNTGRRASGGPVYAGQSYLVGEQGPELLTMGSNGYVTANRNLGGNITINVSALSSAGVEEAVVEGLRRANRQGLTQLVA
jgi:hypothetical protein